MQTRLPGSGQDLGPQEYKTEERIVLNGAACVMSYTDLTTGLAHWRMPKAAGKFKAGDAPTTTPNANWYKPPVLLPVLTPLRANL